MTQQGNLLGKGEQQMISFFIWWIQGRNVHKFHSNWPQAAVVVVTLSETGVRTTLWGGGPICSSWGMSHNVTNMEQCHTVSKCDQCGTEFTVCTAMRVTALQYLLSPARADTRYLTPQIPNHPCPPPKTNQSFQTLSHIPCNLDTSREHIFWRSFWRENIKIQNLTENAKCGEQCEGEDFQRWWITD